MFANGRLIPDRPIPFRSVIPAFTGMMLCVARQAALVLVCCGVSMTAVNAAEVKGTFLGDGTYATKEGCEKLKKIAAGGDKNVETTPETLNQDGFSTWEGGCSFKSISEKDKDRRWIAVMDCAEGDTEESETDTFEKMLDGAIKVTVEGKSTTFYRCDASK